MSATRTEPIPQHWTTTCGAAGAGAGADVDADVGASAAEVNGRLASLEISDISPPLVPYLAAAAAELALLVDIRWGFSTDDPPVALLRLIAKATMLAPHAGGAHTARLLEQLEALDSGVVRQ